MTRRDLVRNSVTYAIAGAILWWIVRDIDAARLLSAFKSADLWIFIPVSLCGFLMWYLGETLLWSRLFSYFHEQTTVREMLPVNGALYFLQAINYAASTSALALYLRRDQGVPLLEAAWTLMFQFFIDAILLSGMMVVFSILVPSSPIAIGFWYALGFFGFLLAIALWWHRGRPLTRPGRWLYQRPSMRTWRRARPGHYLGLFAIRGPIFLLNSLVLWGQMLAFGIRIPLAQVVAFNPAVIMLGATPVTPVGIGSFQAIIVYGFIRFAGRHRLLAMSLAASAIQLTFRIPLGFSSAGRFARELLSGRSDPPGEPPPQPDCSEQQAQ